MGRMVKQDNMGVFRFVDNGEAVPVLRREHPLSLDDSKPLLEQGEAATRLPNNPFAWVGAEVIDTAGTRNFVTEVRTSYSMNGPTVEMHVVGDASLRRQVGARLMLDHGWELAKRGPDHDKYTSVEATTHLDIKPQNAPLPLPERLQEGDVLGLPFAESNRWRVVDRWRDGRYLLERQPPDEYELDRASLATLRATGLCLLSGPSYEAARAAMVKAASAAVLTGYSVVDVASGEVMHPERFERRHDPAPAPRPGQTWAIRKCFRAGETIAHDRQFVIVDELSPGVFICRHEDGDRTIGSIAYVPGAIEYVSGPTQPETPQERRARELRIDVETHRPEGVSRDAYVRAYTGAYEDEQRRAKQAETLEQLKLFGLTAPLEWCRDTLGVKPTRDLFALRAEARAAAVRGAK